MQANVFPTSAPGMGVSASPPVMRSISATESYTEPSLAQLPAEISCGLDLNEESRESLQAVLMVL